MKRYSNIKRLMKNLVSPRKREVSHEHEKWQPFFSDINKNKEELNNQLGESPDISLRTFIVRMDNGKPVKVLLLF